MLHPAKIHIAFPTVLHFRHNDNSDNVDLRYLEGQDLARRHRTKYICLWNRSHGSHWKMWLGMSSTKYLSPTWLSQGIVNLSSQSRPTNPELSKMLKRRQRSVQISFHSQLGLSDNNRLKANSIETLTKLSRTTSMTAAAGSRSISNCDCKEVGLALIYWELLGAIVFIYLHCDEHAQGVPDSFQRQVTW